MKGAVRVALIATIGNFLQGWDNATIAGAIVYIKEDFALETTVEGLVVAMSLIGATLITTCSGAISDVIGRRPMLIASSVLYFVSGLVMLWSPNEYVLCVARLLDGFGIGLAVTLIPIYISETAPPEIRGRLNTLPQFTGSGGMFLSYCMVFGMSLLASPSWRLMLGVLSAPSLVYFVLTVFYLPESPRWLVSKGKMLEAKGVLQKLRGVQDVSGEMALLVQGLGIGGEPRFEEYSLGNDLHDGSGGDEGEGSFRLYSTVDGLTWIAKPVGQSSSLALTSRQGSLASKVDPLVTLFDSVHDLGSTMLPNLGSTYSLTTKNEPNWDEESVGGEGGEGYNSDDTNALQTPLMSNQVLSLEKDMALGSTPHGSVMSMRRDSNLVAAQGSGTGIGGGWQLAWKWSEKDGELKRVYMHESLAGDDSIQAAALVSKAALLSDENTVGPAMVHPSGTASKTPVWVGLLEPGVKHALIVGIGIQILQQFSGINGVLYYTPQILEEAGVQVLLSNLGLSSNSSSFLISAFTTLLMLPCIAVAMRLMDISGRRWLLLTTIPVLIVALVALVIGNLVNLGSVVHAVVSTTCVVIYFCCFVMAYGPIPNIICAEIFPTRVRGLCIAICSLVFWICDIIVTYTLPVMLSSIGLAGVFGIYAVVCVASWIFVYYKVPETKGMPLEVITEFFAVRARQPNNELPSEPDNRAMSERSH